MPAMLDRDLAYHAAGQAVARYLVAAKIGIEESRAVSMIVVDTAAARDGMPPIVAGPMFNEGICEILRREGEAASPEQISRMLEALPGRGILFDAENWVSARALIAVAGGVAEAAIDGENPNEVLAAIGILGLREFVRDFYMAGRSDPDELAAAWSNAVDRARRLFACPDVRAAIDAVAASLSSAKGVVEGAAVAAIIKSAMMAPSGVRRPVN